jgi:phosphoglycerol transferase MdoB-like AlkP superfamily enzyme
VSIPSWCRAHHVVTLAQLFTVRVKQPQSIAGRCWNATQSVLSLGSVALIVLKLTGVIDWSWWWVLAPVWISGILLVAVLCGLAVLLSWGWAEGRKRR